MNYLPASILDLVTELRLAPLWTIWAQVAAFSLASIIGATTGMWAKRLLSKREAKRPSLAALPLGLMTAVLLLWVAHAAFVQAGIAAAPLRIAAVLLTAWAAMKLVLRLIGRTTLGWAAAFVIAFVGVLEILGFAQPVAQILDSRGVQFGAVNLTIWFAIKSLIIVAALFWAAQRLADVVDRALAAEKVLSRSGKVLTGKLARAGLMAIAVFLSLGFLGVDITTLAVLSGAIGLGLGFGLQKVVSNYVAGLILLFDRSIKPGDVIEVEFGGEQLRGEVTELAGRYTAITLRTGIETLIPNEVLISSPVSNWSHTSRNVQLRIPVGVAYSTDVEKAMKLCVEAALASTRVLQSPKPVCLIVGFGDSSVDLDVRFWIADSEAGVRNVCSNVYLEIWKRFQEHDVEIPFPQRDLHIKSWPADAKRMVEEG